MLGAAMTLGARAVASGVERRGDAGVAVVLGRVGDEVDDGVGLRRLAARDHLGGASPARYSSSSGSPGAITVAPACAASWTAKLPTPPLAPTISTRSPGCGSIASTHASAVTPASGAAPAVARSTPCGALRDRLLRADGDQLGPRAVVHGRVRVR